MSAPSLDLGGFRLDLSARIALAFMPAPFGAITHTVIPSGVCEVRNPSSGLGRPVLLLGLLGPLHYLLTSFHCYTLLLRAEGMARGTFGERLKRERELREVTLEEITSATRIGPRFLDALENEDWEKLPGGVFNRGFVRAIARYLGLDEEAFLAEYDLAHNSQVPNEPLRPENRIPSPPHWFPFALILGALLLLVALFVGGLYGWRYYRARKALASPAAPVTPQTSASPSSSSANSASPVPAPSEPSLDLSVSASAPARVRVESDGYVVFDSDMHAGENHHFYAINTFEVSVSDSAAVLLEMNGQAMPPLGPPGSSGTIKLNRNDLKQAPSGNPRP